MQYERRKIKRKEYIEKISSYNSPFRGEILVVDGLGKEKESL